MMVQSPLHSSLPTGALLFADGTMFSGYSFGAQKDQLAKGVLGEVIFNTAMTGYQEILTDPSYYGQIVVMTYPHIGNYGFNPDDNESPKCYASGLIVHEYCEEPSNWKSKESLATFLKRHGIAALTGIDTRAITRYIRSAGAMNAYLVSPAPKNKAEVEDILARLRKEPSFGDRDLVFEVSCKEAYDFNSPYAPHQGAWNFPLTKAKDKPLVVVLDFGVKQNTLRSLVERGCRVKVVPARTSADEILAMNPKGIILSNGPGDPALVQSAPANIRSLLGKLPIFGICMGHQVLAHAIGAKTFKLKFGHHGANQPVLDIESGRVMITSQNHGYAVDPETMPKGAKVTQINLNDKSVEGISLPEQRALSVQYHPEASPGPHDSMAYFDDFMKAMNYV